MKKFLFLSSIFFVINSPCFADEQASAYVGGAYHMGTYEEDNIPDFELGGIELKVGKYLAPQVAVEGRFILPVADDSAEVDGVDIDLELKKAISFFLRGNIPLSQSANVYGLLGFTKGKLEAKASYQGQSMTISDSDSGLSYGFGVDGEISPGLAINAEYIFYLSEDDYDYTGIVIGLTKKF